MNLKNGQLSARGGPIVARDTYRMLAGMLVILIYNLKNSGIVKPRVRISPQSGTWPGACDFDTYDMCIW